MRFDVRSFFSRESKSSEPQAGPSEPTIVQIDATSLSRVFSAPIWLRDLGLLAWFLVGLIIILVALVWLFAVTAVIVGPVIVGAILATVAGPLVTKMQGRVGRAGGAAIVLLGLLALGALITLLVVGGLYEQSGDIKSSLSDAKDKFQGWLESLGIDSSKTTDGASSGVSQTTDQFVNGIKTGIDDLGRALARLGLVARAQADMADTQALGNEVFDGHPGEIVVARQLHHRGHIAARRVVLLSQPPAKWPA